VVYTPHSLCCIFSSNRLNVDYREALTLAFTQRAGWWRSWGSIKITFIYIWLCLSGADDGQATFYVSYEWVRIFGTTSQSDANSRFFGDNEKNIHLK